MANQYPHPMHAAAGPHALGIDDHGARTGEFWACTGQLPRKLGSGGGWEVSLIGCSVSAAGVGELVLIADSSGKRQLRNLGHMQEPLDHLAVFVASRRCSCIVGGRAVVCRADGIPVTEPLRLSIELASNSSLSASRSTNLALLRGTMRKNAICTGTSIYSVTDLAGLVTRVKRTWNAWTAVGFHSWHTFARSKESCDALEQMAGVTCEVRRKLENLPAYPKEW